MSGGDGPRRVLAIALGPAFPQPLRRIETGGVAIAQQRRTLAGDSAQYGIGEPLEMCLIRAVHQTHRRIDGRVCRRAEEEKLRSTQPQDLMSEGVSACNGRSINSPRTSSFKHRKASRSRTKARSRGSRTGKPLCRDSAAGLVGAGDQEFGDAPGARRSSSSPGAINAVARLSWPGMLGLQTNRRNSPMKKLALALAIGLLGPRRWHRTRPSISNLDLAAARPSAGASDQEWAPTSKASNGTIKTRSSLPSSARR